MGNNNPPFPPGALPTLLDSLADGHGNDSPLSALRAWWLSKARVRVTLLPLPIEERGIGDIAPPATVLFALQPGGGEMGTCEGTPPLPKPGLLTAEGVLQGFDAQWNVVLGRVTWGSGGNTGNHSERHVFISGARVVTVIPL